MHIGNIDRMVDGLVVGQEPCPLGTKPRLYIISPVSVCVLILLYACRSTIQDFQRWRLMECNGRNEMILVYPYVGHMLVGENVQILQNVASNCLN